MTIPFASLGAPLLASFGAQALVTIERRAASAGIDPATGHWTSGAITSTPTDAVVLPVTSAEASALPEGLRADRMIQLFTLTALLMADEATGQQADVVLWQARRWQVVQVEDWTAQAGYAHAFAARMD